jgi:tripartite-type tricarboxylate transporter receptor subunit TctC
MQKTGTQFTHIPYQGSAPAMLAVMAGQVDMMVMALNAAMPNRSKMRILGVTSETRVAGAEDIPTLQEQGVPVNVSNWICLVAPHATPEATVNILSNHLVEIGRQEDVLTLLRQQFAEPFPINSAQLDVHIRSELVKWGDIMRRANIVQEQA